MREFLRRLKHLATGSRFNSELGDEIEFHIACRADELRLEGLPDEEALARARREFGRSTRAIEETHDAWRMNWLADLASDLRYAARAFRRNPGFALTAILCLALGIGANTTIFSITMSMLFSQPSVRDADSVITMWLAGNSNSDLVDYHFLRDSHIFEGLAGINPERELNWRDGDRTVRVPASLVTDDYFHTLGIPFEIGRGIAPGETSTTVISDRLWHGRFGGDPGILGRRLVLDGRVYTIAGVLPADHRTVVGFGLAPDIYAPAIRPDDTVMVYARMPRGMTIPVARARLAGVLSELDRVHPRNPPRAAQHTPITHVYGADWLRNQMPGAVIAFFAMLMTLVGLVLLIACTNVASLLLARASTRSQELAVRLSLGASRARIVRHLMAESLLLALLGAGVGVLMSIVCARVVSNITLPLPVPVHLVIEPDLRLLEYSLAIVLGTALVCGLLPALRAARRDVNVVLKSEERQTGRTWGLRSVLVAGQLAVTVVLLSAGFLFLHNLMRAATVNPGFDVNHLVWASMRLLPERYPTAAAQQAMAARALERVRAIPGVEAAAITAHVPLNNNCRTGIDLRTTPGGQATQVEYECESVGPDYFRTMRIPMLAGREFNSHDDTGADHVAIMNQTFARQVFGAVNPIGHMIYQHDWPPLRIVGVVADSKYFSMSEDQRAALFEPWAANVQSGELQLMIRTRGAPARYVKNINDALGGLDTTAALETKPMNQALGFALLPSRAGAAMLGAMGLLGLALASIGLYGVLLYSVSRRTREIGLRVALGASPAEVLRIVCRHSLALVTAGMVTGLGLANLAMRPMAMFLVPGLNPADPAAFLAVIGVLTIIAFAATLAPALRALRVDPMTALKYE